ncbi:hypothetical protein M0802_004438 [Mischocyttarus mexicanus]|nr:hypothetical protein M0802_004438 [Mischocyttarus mexicanus]
MAEDYIQLVKLRLREDAGPGGQDSSHYVHGLIVMQKLQMANEMIEVSVSEGTLRAIVAGLFANWLRAA